MRKADGLSGRKISITINIQMPAQQKLEKGETDEDSSNFSVRHLFLPVFTEQSLNKNLIKGIKYVIVRV